MNQSTHRTIRDVPREVTRSDSGTDAQDETTEQGNLVIEALTLLVQRQREIETWVAEQVWQAEERVAATEGQYSDLERRLQDIEARLGRLAHQLELRQSDEPSNSRLIELREQIEALRSTPNGLRAPLVETSSETTFTTQARESHTTRRDVGLWDLLGQSGQERVGLIVMGLGGVAALFAILSQLRF